MNKKQGLATLLGIMCAFWIWQFSIKNQLSRYDQSCYQSYFNCQIQYKKQLRFIQKYSIHLDEQNKISTNKTLKSIAKLNARNLKKQKALTQHTLKKIQKNLPEKIFQYIQHTAKENNDKFTLALNDYHANHLFLNNKIKRIPYRWIANYYNINPKKTLTNGEINSVKF